MEHNKHVSSVSKHNYKWNHCNGNLLIIFGFFFVCGHKNVGEIFIEIEINAGWMEVCKYVCFDNEILFSFLIIHHFNRKI